jgi:sec-independent protein translocase protein TatA
MPNFGVWEWLVILIIVLVIFGASRLKDIGQGLGGAINAFRREVKQGKEEEEDLVADSIRKQEEQTEAYLAVLAPRANWCPKHRPRRHLDWLG